MEVVLLIYVRAILQELSYSYEQLYRRLMIHATAVAVLIVVSKAAIVEAETT